MAINNEYRVIVHGEEQQLFLCFLFSVWLCESIKDFTAFFDAKIVLQKTEDNHIETDTHPIYFSYYFIKFCRAIAL